MPRAHELIVRTEVERYVERFGPLDTVALSKHFGVTSSTMLSILHELSTLYSFPAPLRNKGKSQKLSWAYGPKPKENQCE